jgi:hypothetical protein
VCLTRVAPTELQTLGNDSWSIPEEAEKDSSSSGIEQESLPTVSSSVGATRVRHTQMYLLFLLLQA